MPAVPRLVLIAFLGFSVSSLNVQAQQDLSSVEIETIPVAEGVFMLEGAGGNIGLSVGDDGAFLIDDQYAPLTEKISAAVAEQTDQTVRFVVNTHWHGDHTGGNEDWGEAGAVIIAHENVRERMTTAQFIEAFGMEVPPSPHAALPVVTFTDAVTLHLNGDEIRVFHAENAHTDGDAIILFTGADVIHSGDTYFNGIFPFIDVGSGGTLHGMIEATDLLLSMAGPETKIIPGHGPLSGRAGLEAFREMLGAAADRIGSMITEGLTKEDVVAAGPMNDYGEKWGNGFLNTDQWVGIAYDAMTGASR